MDNYVKLIILILISISLIIIVNGWDIGRSYSIDQATIDLFIENDTELHVKESLIYSFKGTYNGIYRDIPLKNGESLENINVSTKGAYSSYKLVRDPYEEGKNLEQIKVYLYSDKAKTKPVTNKNVTIHINYDFKNVITTNENSGNLVYNLWGDLWKVELGKLNAAIHLNSKNNVKYRFNSQEQVKKIYWEGPTLNIETTSIPPDTYLQINMTFPLNNSIISNIITVPNNYENSNINNISNASNNKSNNITALVESSDENVINKIGPINFAQVFYEERLKDEDQKYENNSEFSYFINIWVIIVLTTLIIPLASYIKYGNPISDYKNEYETNKLSLESPAIINSLFGKGLRKNVGETNIDGYQATILDLINKKYLRMKFIKSKSGHSPIDNNASNNINSQKKMILTINRKLLNCNKNKLKEYEKSVIKSLVAIENNGIIDFEKADEILNKRTKARMFQKNYYEWKDNLKEYTDDLLNKYYNSKCSIILRNYGLLAISLGLINLTLLIFSTNMIILIIGLLTLILGIIFEITPTKNLGGWNKDGKILKYRWRKFKKCFKSESKIKNYITQDPSKLNEYLAYAVALGISKNVNKNFRSFPSEILSHIDLYPYFKYPTSYLIKQYVGAGLFADSSYSAYRYGNEGNNGDNSGGSSGGGGGAGGGSGGGGGGAF